MAESSDLREQVQAGDGDLDAEGDKDRDHPEPSGDEKEEKHHPSEAGIAFKVDLLLKATGDAPIMKKKKWTVDPSKTVSWVIEFIRRYLKLENNESLFLYVNQAFAPSPDQVIRNLYQCFGSDGKLVLYYAKSQAWG